MYVIIETEVLGKFACKWYEIMLYKNKLFTAHLQVLLPYIRIESEQTARLPSSRPSGRTSIVCATVRTNYLPSMCTRYMTFLTFTTPYHGSPCAGWPARPRGLAARRVVQKFTAIFGVSKTSLQIPI